MQQQRSKPEHMQPIQQLMGNISDKVRFTWATILPVCLISIGIKITLSKKGGGNSLRPRVVESSGQDRDNKVADAHDNRAANEYGLSSYLVDIYDSRDSGEEHPTDK